MKYLSCAVVALIGLSAPAAAADMGGSSDSGYKSDTTPNTTWSGFYLGAELGYGKANGDVSTHSTHTTPAVPGTPGVAGVPGKDAIPGIPGAGRPASTEPCVAGTTGCVGGHAEVIAHTAGTPCATPNVGGCSYNYRPNHQRWEWDTNVSHQDATTGVRTFSAGAVCNYGEAYCHGATPAVAAHTAGTACYTTDTSCFNHVWQTSVDATPAIAGRTGVSEPCVAGREGCVGGSVAVAAIPAVDAVAAIPAIAGSVIVSDDYSSISPAGLFGDITLGADFQPAGSNLLFGLYGDYSFGSIDAHTNIASNDVTMAIDNQYGLGIRAGYLVSQNTLAYAKLGYSAGELSVSHAGPDGAGWSNPSLSGYLVGAGVETRLTGNLFGRAEYDYTSYGKNTFHSSSDAATGDTSTSEVDLSEHRAKIGLVYKFGVK